MFFIAVMVAGLWGLGAAFGAPQRARCIMILALLVAVIAVHLVLPIGHTVRLGLGETAAPWLFVLGIAGLVWGYRWMLRRLRTQAVVKEEAAAIDAHLFSETELNRYARHIVMREIGGAGQKALKEAKVLVVGAGGLGSPVLQYLAAAGVGTVGVIDDDVVDNANLQRQVIHRDDDIGTAKVFSAKVAMIAQNPFINVRPYQRRLTYDIAAELIAEYDLVLDGCDNFETRYLVNKVCVQVQTPLISGALTQWEGQLSVFDPAKGAPCYQCIFPQAPGPELVPSCSEAGVIGPLPGVVGSMMAIEAIKVITGAGAPLRGEMVVYDGLYGESRKIALEPRAECPICSKPE